MNEYRRGGSHESGPGAHHHLRWHIFPRDSGGIAEPRASIATEQFHGSAIQFHGRNEGNGHPFTNGARRDMVQDGASNAIEQSREKLLATVPNNDKGQAFVNAFAANCQKKFDVDQVTEQLVSVYDKHFTEEEIRGLLQFYGSPLGQKVASEMPKISREIQSATRAAGNKAAKEALAELKQQNPEVGQSARLGLGQGRWQQRRGQQQSQQSAQQLPPQ
jgi:hypothetical protein